MFQILIGSTEVEISSSPQWCTVPDLLLFVYTCPFSGQNLYNIKSTCSPLLLTFETSSRSDLHSKPSVTKCHKQLRCLHQFQRVSLVCFILVNSVLGSVVVTKSPPKTLLRRIRISTCDVPYFSWDTSIEHWWRYSEYNCRCSKSLWRYHNRPILMFRILRCRKGLKLYLLYTFIQYQCQVNIRGHSTLEPETNENGGELVIDKVLRKSKVYTVWRPENVDKKQQQQQWDPTGRRVMWDRRDVEGWG